MTTQDRARQLVSAIRMFARDEDAIALAAAFLEQAQLLGAKAEAEDRLQAERERHERWTNLKVAG